MFSNLVFVLLILHSALYAVLYEHWATVSATIESSLKSMISNRTWIDPTPGLPEILQGKLTGIVVFKTISDLVIQYAETSSDPLIAIDITVGCSTALRPRWRPIPNSMSLSSISPNGSTSGRLVSYHIPRHSRIPLRPIRRPAG